MEPVDPAKRNSELWCSCFWTFWVGRLVLEEQGVFLEQNWGVRAAGSSLWVWLSSSRAPGGSLPTATFVVGDAKVSGTAAQPRLSLLPGGPGPSPRWVYRPQQLGGGKTGELG